VEGKPNIKRDGWDAMRLWNMAEEAEEAVLLKNNEHVSSIVVSPDGNFILAAIEYGDKGDDILDEDGIHPHCGITMFIRGQTVDKKVVWKRNTDECGDPIMMQLLNLTPNS